MNKYSLILLIFLLIPAIVLADTSATVLEVTGTGISRNEAIQNGLIEALKQAKGVAIDSRKSYIKNIQEVRRSKNRHNEHYVGINKLSHSKVRELTNGVINEYRIINERKTTGGDWQITLAVKMFRYITPGISPNSRRKIAVMPFRNVKTNFSIDGSSIPSWEISREFSQKLVDDLTQSRRFTVLDREYIRNYLKEKNLVLSGNMPLKEQVHLGQVLGVDYMLVGTISNFELERVAYQIKMLDKTGYRNKAKFIADYRIIVMPTRQVKWSDSVTLNLDTNALRRLVDSDDPEIIQHALLAEGARQIVYKALANIYPIRIATIQPGGRLIFNQGGKTVSEGELFDIFKVGDKVVDPYSGESLGAAETWIATAKVERVLAKQSYAAVIKGDVHGIKVDDICRRTKIQKQPHVKPERKISVPW